MSHPLRHANRIVLPAVQLLTSVRMDAAVVADPQMDRLALNVATVEHEIGRRSQGIGVSLDDPIAAAVLGEKLFGGTI